jgi:uncharacterized membrane protein
MPEMEILLEGIAMALCARCGVSLSENTGFCPSCGTPVMGAPPAGAPVGGPQSTDMSSNLVGALAYLFGFVSGIILLKIERYKQNPFVRFHAFQSIFLGVSAVVFFMVLGMMSAMLSAGFLWSLVALLKGLLALAFVLIEFFMMYKAFKGECFALPFIGPMAARRAG